MTLTRRAFAGSLLAAPAVLRAAQAARLPALPNVAAQDADFAAPGSALYDATLPAYNLRTELRPALRILVKTPRGVRQAVDWLRTNGLAFALRSGGHSYEGFSQSTDVVLDTRRMNALAFDAATGTLSVGAGAALGDIYRFVAARGYGFAAGSCPTVGVGGHTLGGGFGLLARERGLTCDQLIGIDLVDANAMEIAADANSNADLFWASRGGGGGTFGAVTQFRYRIAPIGPVAVYGVTWNLNESDAAKLFSAWQAWAPAAPDAITGFLRILKRHDGLLELHVAGQTTGSVTALRRELSVLTATREPASGPIVRAMSFLGAVNHFSGGWSYESQYSKAKSDFIAKPLDPAGIDALLGGIAELPPGAVVVICDAYGGALGRTMGGAFAYRAGTKFCIQYYADWASPAAGPKRMDDLRRLYAALRPWSAGAYVNYCDLDLADWRHAYWRQNFDRLLAIKTKRDPDGIFRHAQSVG